MKFNPAVCLLLALFCACLDAIAAEALKSNAPECPRGIPASVCKRRIRLFPFPRIGRRQDPDFERVARSFGLIKQPRIGRSDPTMSGSSKWIHEDGWLDDASNDSANSAAYRRRAAEEEKEEGLNNLSAQRRDSNAPWAFFVITPNFQSLDQQQTVDGLMSQLEHGNDYGMDE
ncbi:uncharacterized protein LOC106641455 [Copidosoma floridanum]|uniref:uncharacterized protein LOC106641455 n=1 Tax=Copidosoma floridanum TaxID=29053 RepID=UPI0006C9DDA5|nr:uncharacterized protein LOC106641455 [Copidosoma floridanum]